MVGIPQQQNSTMIRIFPPYSGILLWWYLVWRYILVMIWWEIGERNDIGGRNLIDKHGFNLLQCAITHYNMLQFATIGKRLLKDWVLHNTPLVKIHLLVSYVENHFDVCLFLCKSCQRWLNIFVIVYSQLVLSTQYNLLDPGRSDKITESTLQCSK